MNSDTATKPGNRFAEMFPYDRVVARVAAALAAAGMLVGALWETIEVPFMSGSYIASTLFFLGFLSFGPSFVGHDYLSKIYDGFWKKFTVWSMWTCVASVGSAFGYQVKALFPTMADTGWVLMGYATSGLLLAWLLAATAMVLVGMWASRKQH